MPEVNIHLIVTGIASAEKEFQKYILQRTKAEKESRKVEKEIEDNLKQLERELRG